MLQTEKTVGGTIKNLTLLSIIPTSRIPPPPTNPKEITDLTYTFDPKEQKLRSDGKLKTGFENINQEEQYNGNEDEDQVYTGPYQDQYSHQHQKYNQRSKRSASSSSEEDSKENTESQTNNNGQYHTGKFTK